MPGPARVRCGPRASRASSTTAASRSATSDVTGGITTGATAFLCVFLAHAPAGYLASRIVGRERAVSVMCIAGALFPDVDMIWFYAVDGGRVHHHTYWTHVPLFWLVLSPVLVWHRFGRAFLLGVATHLVLDTVAGDIQWLQPMSDRFVHLVRVPARPGAHWIVSFVCHWTFLIELGIALTALVTWRASRRRA